MLRIINGIFVEDLGPALQYIVFAAFILYFTYFTKDNSPFCFGFCFSVWEHGEMPPLSSQSQRGYFLLMMALELKWNNSQHLQVAQLSVFVLVLVCVLLLFVKCVYVTGEGLGPVEVSESCLCWSEIPKSNKYWRYERTAPLRLLCQHYCLMLA